MQSSGVSRWWGVRKEISWDEYLNCLTDTLRRKRKQKLNTRKKYLWPRNPVNDEREKARRETRTTTTERDGEESSLYLYIYIIHGYKTRESLDKIWSFFGSNLINCKNIYRIDSAVILSLYIILYEIIFNSLLLLT